MLKDHQLTVFLIFCQEHFSQFVNYWWINGEPREGLIEAERNSIPPIHPNSYSTHTLSSTTQDNKRRQRQQGQQQGMKLKGIVNTLLKKTPFQYQCITLSSRIHFAQHEEQQWLKLLFNAISHSLAVQHCSLLMTRAKPLKFHTNTSNPASQSWGKSGFKLSTHEITQRSQNKIKLLKPFKVFREYTICFFCWYWWEGNEQDLHMQMDIVPILGQLGSNVRQQTNKREQHSWRHTWCAVFSNHKSYKHTCWVSNCAWQNIYIAQIGQLRKHISCDQINIQWGKNERVAFIIKYEMCSIFLHFSAAEHWTKIHWATVAPSSLSKTELAATNIMQVKHYATNIIQQILCNEYYASQTARMILILAKTSL